MPSTRRSTTRTASSARSSVADVFALFDEYAAAYARGEQPRAEDYLARAGGEAGELAALLERFLAAAPAPVEADARVLGAFLAGEPSLLALRTRRRVTRDAVVDAIVTRVRLATAKRAKVKRYYHELETGLLAPDGVDGRVLEAIAETLGARIGELFAWSARPLRVETAYLRASLEAPAAASAPTAAA